MKKLLALLGVVSLGVTATSTVVACGPADEAVLYDINLETLNSLTKVINHYEDETIPVKDYTYQDFFYMNEEAPDYNFIEVNLYQKIRDDLNISSQEMSNDEIESQIQEVRKWAQEAITLVYVDRDDYSNDESEQEIVSTITRENAGDKTLERILKDEVIANYDDLESDEDLTSDWWKEHNKASLAIAFNPEVKNIKLTDNTKSFWTFTFVLDEGFNI